MLQLCRSFLLDMSQNGTLEEHCSSQWPSAHVVCLRGRDYHLRYFNISVKLLGEIIIRRFGLQCQ